MASLPPVLQSRRARIALGVVLAVLVLRALLPLALARALAWGGERETGLNVEVGDVDLAVLRGGVALERVAVAGVGAEPLADGGVDPETALLRFERLAANLQWLSLLRGRIHLAELELTAPLVGLELDPYGRLLLPEPAPEEGAADPAASPDADDAQAEMPSPDEAESETAAPDEAESETATTDEAESETALPDEKAGDAAAAEGEDGAGWPILLDRLAITGARLRVNDPALAGAEPAVDLGFGAFALDDLRFAEGSLGLGGVGLEDPVVRVRRDFFLADRPPAPEAPPEGAPPEASGPDHRVERIAIDRAEFTLLTDGGPLAVALDLEATDVVTAQGEVFPFHVGLAVGDGRFDVSGKAGIEPPSFTGVVAWQALPLPQLALAIDPALAGWLRAASATGRLEIGFGASADGALAIRGSARLDGLDFAQPDSEDVSVRWETLAVQLERAVLPLGGRNEAADIDVAEIEVAAPRLRYTLPAPALDALLGGEEGETTEAADAEPDEAADAEPDEAADAEPDEAADAEPDEAADAEPDAEDGARAEGDAPPPPTAPTRVRVRRLSLTDGDLRFVDRTVDPAYEGHLAQLEISASELRLPENRAGKLQLSGRAPGGAGFSLNGDVEQDGRLVFELERLGLAQFDTYTASAIGYRARGEATLKTEIDLRKEGVQVGNQLVLHDIGLQSAGAAILDDLIGMPADLALALLRDLAGNIRLGIPLSVDRDGVRVSFGTVLRDAVRNAIAGAVLAPLKLAGAAASPFQALGSALVGGRDGRLSIPPLAAVPGEARLVDGEHERLDAMIEFLSARPLVLLVLHGRADESDRDGIARRMLIETVQADESLPELQDTGFFTRRGVRGALAAMGRGETPSLDEDERGLLDRYLEAVKVPPERYDALARERAERLRAELIELRGLDPARLRVPDEVEDGPPGVRVVLGVVESR